MKKQHLKNLSLQKKSISNLKYQQIKGGSGSWWIICDIEVTGIQCTHH
jgi:hypothetical protein